MTDTATGTLVLHRFCGDEVYRLNRAVATTTEDESGATLCLEAWSEGEPIQTLEDTAPLNARPHVSAYVPVPSCDLGSLVGMRFVLPAGYDEGADDWVASIYYCEHEDLDNNEMEIVATEA